MSYPQPTELRRRPTAVTTAAAVMVGMATLGLVGAVLTLVTVNGIIADFRAAATGANANQVNALAGFLRTYSVLAAVFGVLGAALLVGLAVGNLRGVRGTRIATWVVCGLGLFLGCCGVLGVLLSGAVQLGSATQTDTQVAQALSAAYPGWWIGVNAAVSGGQAVGYIAVAILLALPAATAFFRRPEPATQWQPPARQMSGQM
jgi:hypothetical protein